MRLLFSLALILCASLCFATDVPIGNSGRHYLIDLPAHPNGAMIVALHAAARSPEDMRKTTGLSPRALAQGYAVIYPQATGGEDHASWNGFYCCGAAQSNQVDDMGFLDKVIADASVRFHLDPSRVYLTGMSNGAVMAETYAVRRARHVKAVAGVAGTVDLVRSPAARVALLHIHGTEDKMVPFAKGYGTKHRGFTFTPVAVEIAAFVAAFGGLHLETRRLGKGQGGIYVVEDDYNDAAGQTQVRLLTVVGGQHVWPEPGRMGKGNTQDISATDEVLRFFAQHP
jgi:polyhydroxybutyrate depolymerase